MKYKGWLILTIILGFFWTPLWIASVIIAIIGIYADKKPIRVRTVTKRPIKRKVRRKPKKKKVKRKKRKR